MRRKKIPSNRICDPLDDCLFRHSRPPRVNRRFFYAVDFQCHETVRQTIRNPCCVFVIRSVISPCVRIDQQRDQTAHHIDGSVISSAYSRNPTIERHSPSRQARSLLQDSRMYSYNRSRSSGFATDIETHRQAALMQRSAMPAAPAISTPPPGNCS